MRPLLAVIGLLVLIILGALNAQAAPARPCRSGGETLTLLPGSLSYNGQAAHQDSIDRFSTDAGVQLFGSGPVPVEAQHVEESSDCLPVAQQVTIVFTDPWTGETRTMSLSGAP